MDIKKFFKYTSLRVNSQINNGFVLNQPSESSIEPIAGTSSSTVSAVISENLTFYNDLGSKDEGPIQQLLDSYPEKDYGKQKRSFSKIYYTEFEWLEYSVQHDRVFCFCCSHFDKKRITILKFL